MNKILIDKEVIEQKIVSNKIVVESVPCASFFGITKVKIKVLKSCNLWIDYILDDNRLDVTIDINDKVTLNLYEYKKGDKGKVRCTFNIGEKSIVNIEKFGEVKNIKEMIITNLNGSGATFNYNFKSICCEKETYDFVIRHNCLKTVSNIKNNAVNILDGKISFQVSSYVPNKMKECVVNQYNRIINLTDNKCEIRPNLYIDEYDVVANHSALIGGFNTDEIFYLQSRGLSKEEANKLLITGFLLSDLNSKILTNKIKKKIKRFWR